MRKSTIQGCGLGLLLGVVGLGGGVLGGMACGTADELFDCQAVCSKYQECLQSSYDVGACRSRCRDKAANDADYKHKADVCHACISDQSCKDSTIKCATECAGIVP
jgi:hypothetical protein